METRHSQIRLYVDQPLQDGAQIMLAKEHAHYLGTVMRKDVGTKLIIFNGKDGAYLCELSEISRKAALVTCLSVSEPQWYGPDLWLLFAPVKKARLDFMAQKATELGAARIWPIRTDYCQVKQIKDERLEANAIEAAEQTERLDIPQIMPFTKLDDLLDAWPDDRALFFCDERLASDQNHSAQRILSQTMPSKAALLVGPEGGFSMSEKAKIDALPQSQGLSLGPRILRADTAALSALSLYQAICGDWSTHRASS